MLRAARLSAGLSEAMLASAAGVEEAAIRGWENGSRCLASAPYAQVGQLEAALRAAGSDYRLLADLTPAAWCDLVLLALSGDGDVACLLADPLAGGDTFSELLGWSLAGRVPERFRRYAANRPLSDLPHAALVTAVTTLLDVVRDLVGSTATSR